MKAKRFSAILCTMMLGCGLSSCSDTSRNPADNQSDGNQQTVSSSQTENRDTVQTQSNELENNQKDESIEESSETAENIKP